MGAIVLDGSGCVVGEGYHRELGAAHAEVAALESAGEQARGGTLVVNLEPCCHTGRTGPCTDAIRSAGIGRVVIAHQDPDARVAGRGVAVLREAGIEVVENVERDAAERLNEVYLLTRRLHRPFVTLKLALTLDGFAADEARRSRWITGRECRRHAHALRARHDAIVVGAHTARDDDPDLGVRLVEGPSPQRFVLVGTEALPEGLKMFGGARPALRVGVRGSDCDWVVSEHEAGRPAVESFLERLWSEEFASVLVEGGPRLAGSFVQARMVDRMTIYYGPCMLGRGQPALESFAVGLDRAVQLTGFDVEKLADGFVVTGDPEFT